MVTRDYTVKLDQVFNGPLDLLLHLVREQEVEIHEIEITRVIDGYLKYLKDLREIDIELAADFLVMAATLMAIKSRSLLPNDDINLAEELDPRDELIQRLIEYRHFKQASRELGERFEARTRIHEHGFVPSPESASSLDLDELSQWDLMAAFSRLMRETLANKQMVITADERPLRFYVEQLVNTMRKQRRVSLRAMVESSIEDGALSKRAMIGTFCALLELVKIGVVRAVQETATDDITVVLRDDLGDDIDQIVKLTEFDDEKTPDETAAQAATDAATAAEQAAPAADALDETSLEDEPAAG